MRRALAHESCWALVPLKAPGLGKLRLAGSLSAALRHQLVQRMAERVIHALRGSAALDGIAVVSPAPLPGVDRWLAEPEPAAFGHGDPLNDALHFAALALGGDGVGELLVVHADLPWIEPADVDALLEAGRRSGLALAADEAGRGTNALYTRLPARIQFAFGRDSLARHAARARAAGLRPAIVERAGLARDIDEPHQIGAALARVTGLDLPVPGHRPPPRPRFAGTDHHGRQPNRPDRP